MRNGVVSATNSGPVYGIRVNDADGKGDNGKSRHHNRVGSWNHCQRRGLDVGLH